MCSHLPFQKYEVMAFEYESTEWTTMLSFCINHTPNVLFIISSLDFSKVE